MTEQPAPAKFLADHADPEEVTFAHVKQARELYPIGSQIVLPAENSTANTDGTYTVKDHREYFLVITDDDEGEDKGAEYVTALDALAFYRPVQTLEQSARAALALLDELVGADILDLEKEQDYEVGLTRTIETLRAALKGGAK